MTRVEQIRSKLEQLKEDKKVLEIKIDEIDYEIFELMSELEEKENYFSLEEREIDY